MFEPIKYIFGDETLTRFYCRFSMMIYCPLTDICPDRQEGELYKEFG
jgi:hypothetical protein